MVTQNCSFTHFILDTCISRNTNPFQQKFAALAARAVFVYTILLLCAPKTDFFDSIFIIFMAKHGNSKW
jgi:hypothetical protein